ncbi:TIGR00730 family Rossman fold protein [Saccharibacter sp. 17.LH.SD]|uniref:LOG family protein n=1 Tax=Saccharibacter sp. 17.LH.SD TaxID=2689393 RepID=UPI001369B73A|nr:TIGR00730 family Rossman fold protein [Saccharibacter sp. 17.LH.SD]MXV44981.1 TIGR00730 family Rossman fold protein [Saccharibacter sp. 17.LH.SD]
MTIQSCSVFCGSRSGYSARYTEDARSLGTALAQNNITLIYGGGQAGLMGSVADATLQAGGNVKGIIPSFLEARELLHEGVTDLEITEDMPSRKAKLFDLADAYIILPGGFGTFDEFSEILVNRQLGLHDKPIIILNTDRWAISLIETLDTAIKQGFAEKHAHDFYHVAPDVSSLIKQLNNF